MKKVFFLLLLLPRLAFGAVAIDADSSSSCSGCSSLSWSHTVGASVTLLMCSVVNTNVAADLLSGLTFNAVSLTAKSSVDSVVGGFLDLRYLPSPAVGAHTVAATLSGTADAIAGGCTSFTGSGAIGGAITAVGTSPSAIVDGVSVSVPTNGLAFGVGLHSYAACINELPDTGNTERYDICADSLGSGANAGAFAVSRTTSGLINWTNRPSGAAEAVIGVPISSSTPPAGAIRRMVVTVQ